MKNYFSGSDFHTLFQPSVCQKRIWLEANRAELAEDDSAFRELLLSRGRIIESRHLESIGEYKRPIYPIGDFKAGFKSTIELIKNKEPVIYQPVLLDETNKYLAIPDLLLLDMNDKYKIRDVKLAVDLKSHPEIALQMGFYRLVCSNILGFYPDIEIVTGDGQLTGYEPAVDEEVLSQIESMISLRSLKEEPLEPVGWSKCGQCIFNSYCWEEAVKCRDIATVPYVDQGAWRALKEKGCKTYEDLYEFSEEIIAEIKRPWGKGYQRIGQSNARKIKLQLKAMLSNEHVITEPPQLPIAPGDRPIVMFDIENDVFDPDLGVKVYLWGCLLALKDSTETELIVAGPGIEGDQEGWFTFLSHTEKIFKQYDDIPFVHYTSHERTWVKKYIERYGDKNNIAGRVLNNLWDMYPCIEKNLFLPVPSYGLKNIEKIVGFNRSQEEYGGLWSIITYDRYLNADSPEKAQAVLSEILTYNTEDLAASLAVYEWLEKVCSK